jgi:hypothetical protein
LKTLGPIGPRAVGERVKIVFYITKVQPLFSLPMVKWLPRTPWGFGEWQ